MRQPRTSERQHMQAPVSEPVRLPPGRRETCRRPRRGHTRMPQRVVSAGREAGSEADFTPRTVAGSAEAAGGGLSEGGALLSSPGRSCRGDGTGAGSLRVQTQPLRRRWGEHQFRNFVQQKDQALQVDERTKWWERSERRQGTDPVGPAYVRAL